MLPLTPSTYGPGILRVTCAGFYSHDRVGHPRIFELPAPVVGHSGIEPETSDLSGLRANRLCQCPMKLPLCQLLYVTGHRETDYIFYISKLSLYLTLLYIEFSSQGCISFQLAWARDCRHPSAPCSHSHIGWISYYQSLLCLPFFTISFI